MKAVSDGWIGIARCRKVEGCLPKPWTPARAVLIGTLVVGVCDALDAIIFFGLRGATPARIFQSIASGLLGRAAFRAGAPAVALGVFLHFFIAFGIVTTYLLASRRFAVLTRRPVLCGLAYGVVAYLVMNFVVIPLSAAGRGGFSLSVVLNGLGVHALFVGLPSALVARAARRSE